jgi:hypothetical protein
MAPRFHILLNINSSSSSSSVGIVGCIEKLLIACASMSLDSCYSAR